MWTGHAISFSEATFIMSVYVVLLVSCCLCGVCEVQKLCFPVETCLRTRVSPCWLPLKRPAPHICRDGLPCWVESGWQRLKGKERRNTSFLQATACLLLFRPAINCRVAENPQPRNVLNTQLCWQLQKSEDFHPLNTCSSDPSCTLAVRYWGRRGLLDRQEVRLRTQHRYLKTTSANWKRKPTFSSECC